MGSIKKGKSKVLATARNNKEELWNKYFNERLFKNIIKDYSFDYQIQTDGCAVSVLYIRNDDIAKKEAQKDAMGKGREETQKMKKTNDDDIMAKFMCSKKKRQKDAKDAAKDKQKEIAKKKRAEFKTLSKEEKNKTTECIQMTKEFPYVEHLVKNLSLRKKLKNYLNNKKLVYGDPGSSSILYLKGSKTFKVPEKPVDVKQTQNNESNNGKPIHRPNKARNPRLGEVFFNYTNRMRLSETKRLKYLKLIENRKKKVKVNGKTIKEHEVELSKY